MAKGNLFLGMGRGSVGDVTFYRSNGQQISRARNRRPSNPKSDAQIYQRAISSTISQAYKAGKAIFDHAFEGRRVPSGNQHRFISVNMRKLRAAIMADLDAAKTAEKSAGVVVSPRSTAPVAFAYRISEGSLIQSLFDYVLDSEEETNIGPCVKMKDSNEGETIAQYCSRLNILPGEIYTIVGMGVPQESDANDLISPACSFGFVRLIVKESVTTDAKTMATATYADFFTQDSAGTTFPEITAVSSLINVDQVCSPCVYGSLGVIRSNENSGLRSTTDMVTPAIVNTEFVDQWGVRSANILAAWSDDASAVQSPLILEGGGF